MKEVLGDSYFNHRANLPDLVLLMDESHRFLTVGSLTVDVLQNAWKEPAKAWS